MPNWLPCRIRSAAFAAALFLAVLAVNALSSISASFDSRWTIPTALSLLDRGDANLDEYAALIKQDGYYGVECVEADGTIVLRGPCAGHYYNWYPAAVSILAAPVALALRVIVPRVSFLLAGVLHGTPERDAFLAGDFLTSHAIVEVLIASFFVALATIVIFQIGRQFLPDSYSVLLALIFAFGTSAWSTASRALWQHGPSMLMLALVVYLLLKAPGNPRLVVWAALPTMFAYLLRPTNALFVAAITLYVALRYRRYLPGFLLLAIAVAAMFAGYSESIYRRPLPSYFTMRPPAPRIPDDALPAMEALSGTLISPSRGLFVYTPIFLFSLWGMVLACRSRWQQPLASVLMATILGSWLLTGVYFQFWWGGHSYGPRLLSDTTPFFVFFLIPVMAGWRESGKRAAPALSFLLLMAMSVFIHSRGARSADVYLWNVDPVNVDAAPARLWDWRDPQFLRGLLKSGAAHGR